MHGADAADSAREAARVVFDRKADPRALTPDLLAMLRAELPFAGLTSSADDAVSVVDLMVGTALVKSKGEARRQLQQGAVTVNGRRLGADDLTVPRSDALHGAWFLIRKGSREVGLVEVGKSAAAVP